MSPLILCGRDQIRIHEIKVYWHKMITVSLKPLIKMKIVYPAEALCVLFLKGNTSDLTIQMLLFIAKNSINVWHSY